MFLQLSLMSDFIFIFNKYLFFLFNAFQNVISGHTTASLVNLLAFTDNVMWYPRFCVLLLFQTLSHSKILRINVIDLFIWEKCLFFELNWIFWVWFYVLPLPKPPSPWTESNECKRYPYRSILFLLKIKNPM